MDEGKDFPSEEEKTKEGEQETEPEAVSESPTTPPEPSFPSAPSQEPSLATPPPATSQGPPSSQEPATPAPESPESIEQTQPAQTQHQEPTEPTVAPVTQTPSEAALIAEKPTYQEPAAQPTPPQTTFIPPTTTPPPAAAPKKKSKKWWILGGCAGCGCLILIALIAFFFIGGGFYLFSGLQAPAKAVDEHLQSVTKGDFAKAYTYLSQELQKEMDLTGFTEFVKTHPENYEGIEKFSTTSVNINNDQASIKGKVTYKDGSTAPVEATLVKEGNLWKIQSIWVKPKDQ